ncbi:unnamed protein product [Brassicogethes aeneus]|uniref:O-acyltransferase WSD1 C-terminal domain-containing protein n=1 Tax=Brassicogethes aeneus TaxID=1431903 RepID=A0A9P0BLB0_BRAAE|nr:unnamed protein product [Brassicogethes aeneus]
MIEFLVTLVLFYGTLCLVPLLALNFLVLRFSRSLWLSCISLLHPEVEFIKYVTVRTLLDTHRNQGIISVLLCVKGQPNPEAVRRHLHELVRRRDKSGNLAFPRLRHCLVTRCGNYAWEKAKFDLDQNLTVAPFTYKGRTVTEYNIQDYVSEIVSKYLPTGVPPWQVVIIPSSEDNHYILFKVHHVLLSEGLNIGDLLPLIPPTRQPSGNFTSKSPLVEVLPKPKVMPVLKEKLTEELSNRWNEFVANYDPLERPELLKNTPTFFEFLSISLITIVSSFKECRRGFRVIKDDIYSRTKYILITLNKETTKRQVTVLNFFLSILCSLDPRNVLSNTFRSLWYVCFVLPVRVPIVIYAEVLAFYTCLTLQYCPYPYTFVGMLYTYVPLFFNTTKELMKILSIFFSAPKTVIQDILLQKESFQTITLCGRKSVAWSDPVKVDFIRQISKATGVSDTEIMLSAVSASVSKYLSQTNHVIPDELPITIRNINSNYIFATGNNVKPGDAMSGILCLNLPIMDPERETTQLDNLMEVRDNFHKVLEKQGLSHLLTILQTRFGVLTKFLPSFLVSVYLKYLSRKYAVSVTELTSRYPNVTQRSLWGQEVSSVIYWRPPQGNTSISLCLNEYADHVKLGVMCDTQLAPQHPLLARNFPDYIQEMAKASNLHQQ